MAMGMGHPDYQAYRGYVEQGYVEQGYIGYVGDCGYTGYVPSWEYPGYTGNFKNTPRSTNIDEIMKKIEQPKRSFIRRILDKL